MAKYLESMRRSNFTGYTAEVLEQKNGGVNCTQTATTEDKIHQSKMEHTIHVLMFGCGLPLSTGATALGR